jgi:cobalamin 5''-phosphate synthase/cobalamin synthase
MAGSGLKLHLQALIAALQFLTRFPVPVEVPFVPAVLKRSVIYFPAAGLAIGLVAGLASLLLPYAVPVWPAAVLLLALWIALSGGLHLDGWMDTADGVLSHRSRERMLDIMKDSRVGAMGVIAAILLLLLKVSLLASLLEYAVREDGRGLLFALLVVSACWSRAWMAAAIAYWPPARGEEGIGAMFNGVNKRNAALSLLTALVISFMTLMISGINLWAASTVSLSAGLVTLLAGGLTAIRLNGKLGGLTGDTYGAMNEAVEAAILLAAVSWLHLF